MKTRWKKNLQFGHQPVLTHHLDLLYHTTASKRERLKTNALPLRRGKAIQTFQTGAPARQRSIFWGKCCPPSSAYMTDSETKQSFGRCCLLLSFYKYYHSTIMVQDKVILGSCVLFNLNPDDATATLCIYTVYLAVLYVIFQISAMLKYWWEY